MSFPTSSIPAILFLNFADDALQVTSPKAPFCDPELFPGGSVFAAWKRTRHCYNFNGARWRKLSASRIVSRHEVSPRLARQCGSQEKQRVQANRSNLQVLLNKVRTLGLQKLVEAFRRKGDWKEIAKLKAKYSILDLQLPACAAAVAFANYAVRSCGPSGLRRTRRFTVADLRRHTFFFCSTNVR